METDGPSCSRKTSAIHAMWVGWLHKFPLYIHAAEFKS